MIRMRKLCEVCKAPTIIRTLIAVTIIFAISLSLTIKYGYVDEMKHFHSEICYISNCTTIYTECCTSQQINIWNELVFRTEDSGTAAFHEVMYKGVTMCLKCLNATITFNLYISNVSNYTKTVWTTNPMWSNYCSMNQQRIYCFYDDRHAFDSLRLFNQYFPDSASNAITVLSIGLVIMIFVTGGVIAFLLGQHQSDIYYESSD